MEKPISLLLLNILAHNVALCFGSQVSTLKLVIHALHPAVHGMQLYYTRYTTAEGCWRLKD